jgi:hypothetical protein
MRWESTELETRENGDREILAAHLVEKYRQLISKRYQYERLRETFTLSQKLDEEVVSDVRNYFLEWLYPPYSKRKQLNDAFETLSSYVSNPVRVFGLLGNMASAILKFGSLLPSAMKAGIASLETFIDARRFEAALLDAAVAHNYQPPLTDRQFMACARQIPKKQAEQFVDRVSSLFNRMTNTRLTGKTITILESVVAKMNSRPSVYPSKDVEGIVLGLETLRHGHAIFKNLDDGLKREITDTINASELNFIKSVHSGFHGQ